jgi:hypothetical protein
MERTGLEKRGEKGTDLFFTFFHFYLRGSVKTRPHSFPQIRRTGRFQSGNIHLTLTYL